MAIAQTQQTLERFLELPEEEPPLEFVDGMVRQKVSPKGKHSALQAELVERLNRDARLRQLARAFPELRTTFAGASRVPDVAVYRWDRIPRDASGKIADNFVEPPDIAIEIVSRDQSANALVRRCLWYIAHGVQIALLVDPIDESVLAFRPDEQVIAWRSQDRIDLGNVIPDLELTVEELFASLQ